MGAELCCGEQIKSKNGNLVKDKNCKESEVKIKLNDIFKLLMETKNKKISMQDFQKIGSLGQGSYGKVYLVEQKSNKAKDTKIQYAMKVIPKRLVYQKRLYQQLINEKQILADVKHHFLIDLIYAFQDQRNCYFVMQYACGGDTYSLISHLSKHIGKVQNFKSLGEDGVRFIMACVVLGLQCLHEHNLVYRDLKPENVLLFSDGYVKLTDFGLSKKVQDGSKTNSFAGTKLFLAPQTVQRKGHDRLVDLWALGVFLNQLLGLDQPFQPQMIVKGKFMKICQSFQKNNNLQKASISGEAKDLIKKLMRVIPESRLGVKGFQEIKNHPFFKSIDWQKLVRLELQSPLKNIVHKFPVKPKIIRQTHLCQDQYFPRIQGLTYDPNGKTYESKHEESLLYTQ